jgi:transcriptional regulator with XRE-family HTH domain
VTSYQREREALGERLRELRRDARLTGQQLAEPHGWHQSKVSKIEAGKQTPSDDDIQAWADTCGAPGEAPDLIASVRSLESQYRQHRRQFRSGMAAAQREFGELESATSHLRDFESVYIPGLLQTAEYARHRLTEGITYDDAYNDLSPSVAARMQRQEVLYRADKKFQIVITEACLRYRLCPKRVMLGQLDRLVSASTMSNLRLGIIPFEAEYIVAPNHGFAVFDNEIARVETFSAELYLTEPSEVELYLRVFADLAKVAKYDAEARAIILRVLADLTSSAD